MLARKQDFQRGRIFEILDPHVLTDRSEWVLAWDFSTASLAATTEHLRFMRDDAFRRLEEINYEYTVDFVFDDYNENIYRKVEGTIKAPLYLATPYPSSKSRLVRNDKAATYLERQRPVFQGWFDVPFIIWIPQKAVKKGGASLVHYGHGLFQSREEAHAAYMQTMSEENNFAYVAGDCK